MGNHFLFLFFLLVPCIFSASIKKELREGRNKTVKEKIREDIGKSLSAWNRIRAANTSLAAYAEGHNMEAEEAADWLVRNAIEKMMRAMEEMKELVKGKGHIQFRPGCAHYCTFSREQQKCRPALICPYGEMLLMSSHTTSTSAFHWSSCQLDSLDHPHSLCCNSSVFVAGFDPRRHDACFWGSCGGQCPEGSKKLSESFGGTTFGLRDFGEYCENRGTKAFCCPDNKLTPLSYQLPSPVRTPYISPLTEEDMDRNVKLFSGAANVHTLDDE